MTYALQLGLTALQPNLFFPTAPISSVKRANLKWNEVAITNITPALLCGTTKGSYLRFQDLYTRWPTLLTKRHLIDVDIL